MMEWLCFGCRSAGVNPGDGSIGIAISDELNQFLGRALIAVISKSLQRHFAGGLVNGPDCNPFRHGDSAAGQGTRRVRATGR